MPTWRDHATSQFPELMAEIEPDDSIGIFFFEVLPTWRDAIRDGDSDLLRRIAMFTHWCLQHDEQAVSNAAGVSFVEHVFDRPELREAAARWVTHRMIAECRCLWEARLSEADRRSVEQLLRRA